MLRINANCVHLHVHNLNLDIKRTRIFGEYFYTELHGNRHFFLETNMICYHV